MAGHLNHSASSPDTSAKSLDTLVILFVLALLAYGAGFVVAPGYFDTPEGASLAVDQYRVADDAKGGMPLFSAGEETGFLNFLFEGLVSGTRNGATIGLMAFLLIVGGAFAMIMRTGAVEALLGHFIRADRTPSAMLVPGLFLSFSLCGAIFGMGEEAIVFTLVLVPALSKAGYDAITAVLVTYVATQVGFATSWMNPFSLVIAQGIAGVPALSGMEYRIAVWGVFTLFGCAFTYRYGQSLLRKHGQVAVTTDTTDTTALSPSLNRSQIMILAIVAAGLVWVMWGVVAEGYYLPEIATQFLAMALASALVSLLSRTDGMTASDFAAAFRDGAAQMAPAVIVIAFAKGIVYLLGGDDAGVPSLLNTLLYHIAGVTSGLTDWLSAAAMLLFQSSINFVVVSGSGQAALTMPLMTPLADLSGVSRQTAVLAFQLGDGLTNIICPASAALMGCLSAAKVEWVTWAKFIFKFQLMLLGLALGAVITAAFIGYS